MRKKLGKFLFVLCVFSSGLLRVWISDNCNDREDLVLIFYYIFIFMGDFFIFIGMNKLICMIYFVMNFDEFF